MNNLVSIKAAINRAQDNTGMHDDSDVPVMIEWAIEGDKKIGSYYNYVERIHVLDVDECTAKLPSGTECVVGVLIGDCGCDCGTLFGSSLVANKVSNKVTSIEKGLIVIDSASEHVVVSNISYVVQNNKIVFAANYGDTKATVKTLGYELDEDGLPMINENHVEALATYIELKMMRRQRWVTGGPQFGAGEIRNKDNDWQEECADARARDNTLTRDQHNEIAEFYNDPLTAFYAAFLLGDPIRNQRYDI